MGLAAGARAEALNRLKRELRNANEEHLSHTGGNGQIASEVLGLIAEFQNVCAESEAALAKFAGAVQRAANAVDSMAMRGCSGSSAAARVPSAALPGWPFGRGGPLLVAPRRRCIDGVSLRPT